MALFPEYVPNGVLKVLHNSFRFKGPGNNVFLVPFSLADPLTDEDSTNDFTSYLIGLLTPSAAMLVILVIWLCAVPWSICCKFEGICSKLCKHAFMWGALTLAFLGWFISIRGNNLLDSGLNGILNDTSSVGNLATDVAYVIGDLVDLTDSYQLGVAGIQSECRDLAQASGFEPDLDSIPSGADFKKSLQDLHERLVGVEPRIDDAVAVALPYVQKISAVYSTFTSIILLFVIFYIAVYAVRQLVELGKISKESKLAHYTQAISDVQCIILCPIGVICILVVWGFAMVFAPLATYGADLCVPSLTVNILQLYADSISSGLSDPTDLCFPDVNGDLVEGALVGNFVCYYTQCEGVSLLFQTTGVIVENDKVTITLIDGLLDILNSLEAEIDANAGAGDEPCTDELGLFITSANAFVDRIREGVSLLTCENVTPLIRDATDDQFCNGIVSGLAIIYITWTAGAVGLMMTICCYCCLQERKHPEQEQYYQPKAIRTLYPYQPQTNAVLGDQKVDINVRHADLSLPSPSPNYAVSIADPGTEVYGQFAHDLSDEKREFDKRIF